MRYKVSGAIAIPRQTGDVPQPCRTGFRWFPQKQFRDVSHETSHQNKTILAASNEPQATKKFFGAAIFQKCCRGVGEQPTFAEQIIFEMVATYEPQANKSFLIQQFFKNAAEVWASSPHLRSKSKLHYEIKQTSKKQSEKSQLPLKSEGCNEIQGFRGNCDSQANWGCAPALPNRIQVVSLEAISGCFT